jgi:curved DNA-binding protein CbpA
MARPPKTAKHFTYAEELVNCGNNYCRSCGGKRGGKFIHGPYWYAYYTKKNGETGKVYIGRDLKGWKAQHEPDTQKPPKTHPAARTTTTNRTKPKAKRPPKTQPEWERMLKPEATPMLAAKLLGVKHGVTRAALTTTYRSAIKAAHPDKGGHPIHAAALNAAYAILKPLTK